MDFTVADLVTWENNMDSCYLFVFKRHKRRLKAVRPTSNMPCRLVSIYTRSSMKIYTIYTIKIWFSTIMKFVITCRFGTSIIGTRIFIGKMTKTATYIYTFCLEYFGEIITNYNMSMMNQLMIRLCLFE